MEVEVLARISAGTRCAAALRKCVTASWVSRAAKVEIYPTIIRPVVFYGCEAWMMTKQMSTNWMCSKTACSGRSVCQYTMVRRERWQEDIIWSCER